MPIVFCEHKIQEYGDSLTCALFPVGFVAGKSSEGAGGAAAQFSIEFAYFKYRIGSRSQEMN